MEELLPGGGVNEVVRVGDTVRRPTGPWSPRVHALLRELRSGGLTATPDFLGVDDQGREILTFMPGDVGNYPLAPAVSSETALVTAARLLRRYHDATVDFARRHRDGWQVPAREPVEVICHNDFAPYNCVLAGDEVVGLIDFDFAHPGPRSWDVANGLYRFAPMTDDTNPDGFGTPAGQARRARLFCDAYGLPDRSGLVDLVVARLHAVVDLMHARAAAGDAAFAGHVAHGHDRLYLRDAEHIARHRDVFEAALGSSDGGGAAPSR
ncbi:phosphotransferase [Micromonospora sp. NPDC047074]|uniref:phosphotransferase n=1 Tax=Micromonospora sp. NPDC047074 TaxID=3154339 RepID=UPI0033ED4078